MNKKGYINGYEDESFKPENQITRQEFAKLISATFYLDIPSPATPSYYDVQPDQWSYNYVEASKDYLTGYYPPGGGKAFFSPETKATREDVAVALVKILGFTTSDLVDKNILQRKFKDIETISYGLRDYVAIATEKSLIGGYEDSTFRPDKPITRAEVATLLYRSVKSSSKDQSDGPVLKVSVPEKTSNGTFYIQGTVTNNAKVTINDQSIETTDGQFKEGFKLDEEGTFDIRIVAKLPSGKATTVTKKVTYEIAGPTLKVDDIPETTTSQTINISGTVSDKSDSNPVVYLNDKKIYSSYGSFSESNISLEEGENILTFKAKNSNGKTTVVKKTITFSSGGPVLKVDDIPDTTTSQTISVSGTVSDKNDSSPVVYLNDKKIYSSYGSFSESNVSLQEGENVLVFKAKNSNGKVTTITKKITFNVGGPILKVYDIPERTKLSTISISGTVSDKNDSSPVVYLNDVRIYSSYGSFSESGIVLKLGQNVLTIKATNNLGKSTTVTKNVYYQK
ncbi:Cellulosome-anchoring protein precursor [compost metagenome]